MTALPLKIDYALAMADGVGRAGGLTDDELGSEGPIVERSVRRVLDEVAAGRLGFWSLPSDRAALDAVDEWIGGLEEGIRDVLVLGIGGSSLGSRAVDSALGGPPGLTDAPARRLHFPDNADPWLLDALLRRLDPQSTLAVVVSKSGGTVETAAQYLVVRRWLEDALGAEHARGHLALVTDPDKGPLRKLARDEGIAAFEVPSSVGGRFSVLSAVGLVPARLAGYDAGALLDGARRMAGACERPELRDNPAALLATLHVLHHRLRGRSIHVLMPYA
ncbi:MAG: glucose-6-phosphate isomerase, partial [Polyangiales bacterium]